MNYEEALEFIYSRRRFQKSSGHERIGRLLELLDNPHKKLRFVHVVGTNGKGSVSTALFNILRRAGYNVGLFTSPFVVDFCERIQDVHGYIMPFMVASITERLKLKTEIMEEEGLYPTTFEIITAMAMVYFAEIECDIVVLEAGIGGGKDSTSVIEAPSLAVLTSVSLDHCDVLGATISEIAKEKCDIIKGGCPVVSYPFEKGGLPFKPQHSEAKQAIITSCREKGSELHVPNVSDVRLFKSDLTGNEFFYKGLHLRSSMCGSYQIANLLTAIEAALVLSENGFEISSFDIERGVTDFFIPGRLECVGERPMIIIDGGHNEGAMEALKASVGSFRKGKTVALCAFMRDKDYDRALRVLGSFADEAVFTCVDFLRGESSLTLKDIAEPYFKKTFFENNADLAFMKAKYLAGEDGTVLVCGSFYLATEIRKKFFS